MSIQIVQTDLQIFACFPVISQLRPHLERSQFILQVRRQMQSGYRLAIVEDQQQIVAVAGFRISESLAWGRFMYIDDLVVEETVRSQGHGEHLMQWLIAYAKQNQCQQLHLDSGVQRFHAHRFYLRQRFIISSHHFSLHL